MACQAYDATKDSIVASYSLERIVAQSSAEPLGNTEIKFAFNQDALADWCQRYNDDSERVQGLYHDIVDNFLVNVQPVVEAAKQDYLVAYTEDMNASLKYANETLDFLFQNITIDGHNFAELGLDRPYVSEEITVEQAAEILDLNAQPTASSSNYLLFGGMAAAVAIGAGAFVMNKAKNATQAHDEPML